MSTGQGRVTREAVKRLPPGVDRLPSGSFRVRVYGTDGQRRTIGTYPSEKEARDAHALARSEMLRGEYVERNRSEITLDAWFQEWMPHRRVRPNTLRVDWDRYRLHIKPYLGDRLLTQLTTYRVGRWITDLERDGRTAATIKKAHTLLSTALGIHGAVGDQRLAQNPCRIVRVSLPERPDWTLLTKAQFELLYEAAGEAFRPIMLLAAHGGLRWSEIAGLQAKDYNRRTILVQRSLVYVPKTGLVTGPTKNRRTREVPLSARCREVLNQHLTEHPVVGDGWIFTRNGQPLPPYYQTGVWKKIREEAGVTCRFHDLRHSCASWMLAGGATTAEVRDMLGHQSITTTELYLHIDRGTLADTVTRALG